VLTTSFDLAVLKPHIAHTQGEILKTHRFFSVFMRVSSRSAFSKTGRFFLLRMRTVDAIRRLFLSLVLLIGLHANGVLRADTNTTSPLLGQSAPEWKLTNWINSPPLHLGDLRGKVVLVRWWTAPDCPYCKATAPALNEFHSVYAGRGLCVIGAYHEKGSKKASLAQVKRFTRQYGFTFPVAVDPEWQTLKKWWLDTGEKDWTSVTFLLDRKGVVRYIHPGGEYVRGDNDYATIRKNIEKLLDEKTDSP
jgi:peroxiredoxin